MTEEARAPERLVRSSAILGAGTLLSRITGLLRVVAAAAVMGVTGSRLADAYNLANTAPNQLYELALGGILTSVLVPIFVESLTKRNHREAWREIANVFWIALAIAAVASVVLVVAAPIVIRITGPTLEPDARALAVYLLRLFGAQVFFYALNALLGGILFARRRFAVPAFVPVLNNLVVIGVFLAFGALLVGEPTVDLSTQLTWLIGFGTTAGVVVMALANIPALKRADAHLGFAFNPGSPIIKKLLRLSMWTLLYVVTNQVGLVVIQNLASRREGDYTAWTQAFMFFQLPIGLLAVSVLTAMLPGLSEAASTDNMDRYRVRLTQAIRLTIFLVLPATIGLVFLAEPIIQLFLERGAFDAEDTALVAGVLRYMAIGLLPFAMFMLVLRSFYALQDTRTPFFVNLVARVFAVAAMIGIYASLGVNGLALVYSLSFLLAVVIGWAVLARRVGTLHTRAILEFLGKVVLASIPMTLLLLFLDVFVGDRSSDYTAIAEVGIGVVVGVGAFALFAHLLRIEEMSQIRQLLIERFKRDAVPGQDQITEPTDDAGPSAPPEVLDPDREP